MHGYFTFRYMYNKTQHSIITRDFPREFIMHSHHGDVRAVLHASDRSRIVMLYTTYIVVYNI